MAKRTGNASTDDKLGPETEDGKETSLMDALCATAAERREGVLMTKQRKLELDPTLDYLINADVQPGLKCRRKVFDLYFDNKAAEEWREMKTLQVYGAAYLSSIGPCLIMTDNIVDRIVECAHYHKIKDLSKLKKETKWIQSEKYGAEVIALIQCHAPWPVGATASPFASTPLRPSASTGSISTTTPVLPRKNKCGACGLEGHNARNWVCVNHPSRSLSSMAITNKENA
ncbi:hypothetical protein SERLA73DRAFT_70610 [Serpula lacrymans var. lacrymans S7.3]|uniref:Uncharacterized protein n=1 Tax=Serpula lacrymans var. lacrymans (strain S7.3) TaxID=936435 RepID=F8PPK0_SERL3|nr:hypothetical protein SERLA73DRAFT_70610 [Serpula lacrymans var. lacrymans S7.3]